MFQATRRRLALWYTIVTAVLLLLFASGMYIYVRSTLIERVDDTLNHVVEVVSRSLVIEPVDTNHTLFRVNVEASFRNNENTVDDDHIDLEWFSPNGEILWSTFFAPLDIPLRPNLSGSTVRLGDGQLLRQVTERVEIKRQVLGYLRVSHPWFEVTKPIRQLMLDLTLGIGIMVIGVGAIGWLLSELAMKPIRESYQRLKQFTSDASHELRNPIATIQTNVQASLADPDLDPHIQRQQLQVIERLTRRLGRLVDDLLFLARQDSGIVPLRFIDVPVDALLMEVIEEQQTIASEKNIHISLDIGETVITNDNNFTIQGDWDKLARLFTNIVSNSVQYTPIAGKINVELQRLGKSNTPYLQIKISDTGIGIPEEALPRLFDRFYRIDPARTHEGDRFLGNTSTGSGLGLAIAQAIVENHHGSIKIESQVNQGTTVTITLPVATE